MKVSTRVRRVHDRRADHHADGIQVVGGARHQVAGPMRLEVGERQLLEVREEVVAHVVFRSREAPMRMRRVQNRNTPPTTPDARSAPP